MSVTLTLSNSEGFMIFLMVLYNKRWGSFSLKKKTKKDILYLWTLNYQLIGERGFSKSLDFSVFSDTI